MRRTGHMTTLDQFSPKTHLAKTEPSTHDPTTAALKDPTFDANSRLAPSAISAIGQDNCDANLHCAMKITIVTPCMTGGWDRYVRDLERGLQGRNIDCRVLALRERSLRAWFRVWREIAESDLVHVIDPAPLGVPAFFAAKMRRLPFVLSAQGTYAVVPLFQRRTAVLTRLVYKYADMVIAISRYTAGCISSEVPSARLTVITHGVWCDKFYVSGREPPMQPLVLSVGAIKRRKGYHVALEAIALLRKKCPGIRYVIVGPVESHPRYVALLRERAQRNDLRDVVDFRGHASDEELKALYASASVFLLPATNEGYAFEGFGLVFLEAAAAGVPAVGTLGNGIEDAVANGTTGLLVPQNDPQGTAAAVERLLSNREEWRRASRAAQAHARARDWSIVAGEYEALYARVLGRR
jgi:phosphatidylinositol alpha-1,6-mannosyltransferase